eukprot:TRINITY_DN3815_c0_g1_i1.p1 TRINITY_DN3815_c0_g1~~TRINITY_DN3815_c0_g1_i1.p1  ORF type:complete len:261 (-),score=28.55 TRINITY_DN3815_c0_g1_i1:131-913(-)
MRLNLLHLNELNLASLRSDAIPGSARYVEIMEDLITSVEVTMPNAEELSLLMNWDGQHFKAYERVDKYMLTMRLIPNARERAAFWKFKVSLQRNISMFERYIDSIESMCDLIVNSSSLKKFLGIVVRIGNYMNYKSKKNQARVFTLVSLEQLSSCKSKRNVTLLAYIVGFARKFHPDCLEFVQELSNIAAVARKATTVNDKERELMQSASDLEKLTKVCTKAYRNGVMLTLRARQSSPLKQKMSSTRKCTKFVDQFGSKM